MDQNAAHCFDSNKQIASIHQIHWQAARAERMRHELAALEARGAGEADRRRADESSRRDARASTLEFEMETSSQAHR